MSTYKTGNGTVIQLGAALGEGGEGKIYSIQNDSSLAAKIYLPGIAAERKDKVCRDDRSKTAYVDTIRRISNRCDSRQQGGVLRIHNAKNAGSKTGSSALWA
jgi:hypothetical protein